MQQNVPLKDYITMKIGGPAKYLASAHTPEELVKLVEQANGSPILVLGQGSNVIVGDKGFDGLVILNRIVGFEPYDETLTSSKIKIGAGEDWDKVVQRSVEMGLSGIECLSAIPGCAGAAPVQNIGAYGQEIANTLLELEAYDLHEKKSVIFANADCDFTYRKSIFNSASKGRYIITSITLELQKNTLQPPFYESLQQYLNKNQITDYSPDSLRRAVVAIRSTKLPDPSLVPNTGSFFKNPFVEQWQVEKLQNEYPDIKVFPMGNNLFKISAGWLIENSGIKEREIEGFKVYEHNALVITNTGNGTYQGLAKLRDSIVEIVRNNFQIVLEQEPEEIGV